VTLGLAVSAGGPFMLVLGTIADHHGPQRAFVVVAAIPVVAVALSSRLAEPSADG
jgi:FSR family fosmidomycin resistance protein-like MFS transporter